MQASSQTIEMTTETLRVDATTHLTTQLTTGASYGTAIGAFFASLTLSDWGILVSIVLGILTFLVNVIFKILERRDRLNHQRKAD